MNWAAIIWMILMVIFLIVEAVCALHLVSIWFAAGALVAAVAALLNAAVWLQVLLFLVVSCLILALMWPFVKKFLNPGLKKTNIDSVIGTEGLVIADIDDLGARGQVKLGSMEWTARSATGDAIPVGTRIRVDRIEGVKVFVTPVHITGRL